MRILAVLLVSVCLLQIAAATSLTESPQALFAQFMTRFNKTYSSQEEFNSRYATFLVNLDRVRELRAGHERATGQSGDDVYGITKFADLSREEFKRHFMGFKGKGVVEAPVAAPLSEAIPETLDWRQKGVVTPVKNQEQCGSCWAFSATEEIESAYAMAGGALTELSPQQIVSCDTVDQGCNGGDTITAYQYVEQAGGLETGKEYPYTSGGGDDGTCKFSASKAVVTLYNYTYATPPCTDACNHQNENLLISNLAEYGPVSICVYAEPWQLYTGGVLSSGCDHAYTDLDHCVQLVGYDKKNSPPYYLIRNSWGTDWGYDGYIYVEIGKNLCGVADEATLVKAKKV